jgi:hypothetical protein
LQLSDRKPTCAKNRAAIIYSKKVIHLILALVEQKDHRIKYTREIKQALLDAVEFVGDEKAAEACSPA